MKPILGIPKLDILDLRHLTPHEKVDPSRVDFLLDQLQKDQVLKNPPLVMPMDRKEESFLILDGATRAEALSRLNYEHVLAQIVYRSNHSVHLQSWNHVLLGPHSQACVSILEDEPGIRVSPISNTGEAQSERMDLPRVRLITSEGQAYAIGFLNETGASEIHFLNILVEAFHDLGRIERTSAQGIRRLYSLYPDLCCLLILPRYELDEVLEVSKAGELFPAGYTRFVVSPRALRVNYDLDWLLAKESLEEKRGQLHQWLQEKIKARQMRYYAESTFLFDE